MQRPEQRPSLNQVTLAVTDIERSLGFYCLLGLWPIVRADHYVRCIVPGNEATLSLHKADAVRSTTVVYLEVDDLDAWCHELEAKGIALRQRPVDQSWGWREAYLEDPDGNTLCLYHAGRIRMRPDWRLEASRSRHLLTPRDFRDWLERYGEAWRARDPAAAAALFSEDALYYETPFDEPGRGREGIARYWQAVPERQDNIEFAHEVLRTHGDIGWARWSAALDDLAKGVRAHLDGVLEAQFDATGCCRVFREWWHRQDGAVLASPHRGE